MKFLVVVSIALVAVASAEVFQPPPAIVKQSQDVAPDGSYSYSYETEHGISHSETGTLVIADEKSAPVVVVQGQYQYTSPEGTPIAVQYVADHNGFQPQGAHIPVIPPLIQRALEYIKTYPTQPENIIDN